MIEVAKVQLESNFILRRLSSPATVLYTCIKSLYCLTNSLQKFPPNFMFILFLKRDGEFVQMVMLHRLSCPYMVKNNNHILPLQNQELLR